MSTLPKILLLCCTLFVVSLGDREDDFVDECMKDNNLTEEELMNYNGNIFTDKYLCYIKCVSMKKGIIDEDGNVDLEKMDVISGPYKLPKSEMAVFLDCINEVGKIRKCKDMRKIDKCYNELLESYEKE